MSTANPMADATASAATVTLSREERDLLWQEFMFLAPYGDAINREAFDPGAREHLLELRDEIGRFVPLIDEIGWSEKDERTEFPLTVPRDQLVEGLDSIRSTCVEEIGSATDGLTRLKAGENIFGGRLPHAAERLISEQEVNVATFARKVATCEAILARIEATR